MRGHIPFLTPLALLALFLSALAPHGFMPGWGEDGFRIEICAETARSIAIGPDDPAYAALAEIYGHSDPSGDHGGGNDASGTTAPCAFAGGSASFDAPPARPVIAALSIPQPLAPETLPTLLRQRFHAPGPPATGPPALA